MNSIVLQLKNYPFWLLLAIASHNTLYASDLRRRITLTRIASYLSQRKMAQLKSKEEKPTVRRETKNASELRQKPKKPKKPKLLFEETVRDVKKGKKRKIYRKLGDKPSDESDGNEFSFGESDLNPDLLDSSKKIIDYDGFLKKLELLEKEGNIREFYKQFNIFSNQIAHAKNLTPQDRLDLYFELLYKNLGSSIHIISYLWDCIINIYHVYVQPYDTEREHIKKLYEIFDTFIITAVPPDAQKILDEMMASYKPYEHLVSLGNALALYQDSQNYTPEQPVDEYPDSNFTDWDNPLRFKLPRNTACYTVPERSTELIAATNNQGIYYFDIKKDSFELLKPQDPRDKKIRYHMSTGHHMSPPKKGTKGQIHTLKAKPQNIPSAALVAFDRYFLGYPSGKIVVNNVEAQTKRVLHGHKRNNAITGLVPLIVDKSPLIASSSRDGFINIWKYDTEDCIQTLQSGIGALDGLTKVVRKNENFLISCAKQRYLEIWKNPGIEDKTQKLKTIEVTYAPILSLGSYQHYFLTGLKNGALLVWDPKIRKCIHELTFRDEFPITQITLNKTALMILQQPTSDTHEAASAGAKKILTLIMLDDQGKEPRMSCNLPIKQGIFYFANRDTINDKKDRND